MSVLGKWQNRVRIILLFTVKFETMKEGINGKELINKRREFWDEMERRFQGSKTPEDDVFYCHPNEDCTTHLCLG